MKTIVAPSLLSADFKCLEKEILNIQTAGADWLHFDVMDGNFVPNISFGLPVLKSIAKCHNMVNDVHIMISNPKAYAKKFVEAGADYVTFHYEACANNDEVSDVIYAIHQAGGKAGMSIKPKTPTEVVIPFLKELDLVLVMSVEPGFGGQGFMNEALGKIFYIKNYLTENNIDCLIEVDGGINNETGKLCKLAGADVLVAGSYLFGQEDAKERITGLKE
ncbi:MAG: ribulose-phosphate 3-epimerase [Bacilli bacterium]|nr:ribulose-phosphate 3-epimerase [Bacilli bacterium]